MVRDGAGGCARRGGGTGAGDGRGTAGGDAADDDAGIDRVEVLVAGKRVRHGLTIGGGVRYVGESDGTVSYARVTATVVERFGAPGFVLADALIGYDLGRLAAKFAGLKLNVNAANLFDTRHIASCFFNNSCYFGASRTVVGTLRYRW